MYLSLGCSVKVRRTRRSRSTRKSHLMEASEILDFRPALAPDSFHRRFLRKCLVWTTCVLPFLTLLELSAAVPANDHCAGAANIPSAGPFPYFTDPVDVADATSTEDTYPACAQFAGLGRSV